jgi:hypothetical protein
MKKLYKKLKKIKDNVKGECEIRIETSYNVSPGVIIAVEWSRWHSTLGVLEQYLSEEELEDKGNKAISKFIEEANKYHDKYNTIPGNGCFAKI